MSRLCAPRSAAWSGRRSRYRMAGISYVEVLIAVVLIMVALVPALEALRPGVAGAGIHSDRVEDHYLITGRLEQLLAEPFTALDAAAQSAGSAETASSYSDTVPMADGRTLVRTVFLSRYDADNSDADNDPFTGTDPDLLWIRVVAGSGGDAITTLISRYE